MALFRCSSGGGGSSSIVSGSVSSVSSGATTTINTGLSTVNKFVIVCAWTRSSTPYCSSTFYNRSASSTKYYASAANATNASGTGYGGSASVGTDVQTNYCISITSLPSSGGNVGVKFPAISGISASYCYWYAE